MLLGTKYRLISGVPPRFCNHAWLYAAVEVEHPEHLIAVRVFENRGPFRHATDTVHELSADEQVRDYLVPYLGSEIGEKGLLYVFEDYCFQSIRDVTTWRMEELRCYLFQVIFAVYALRKFHNLSHGNLHRGNVLLFHDPWVLGRTYHDAEDTWRVDCRHSVRFSDFSCSRKDGHSDLPPLERSFNKVPVRDGSTQDRAMLEDVRRKMREAATPESLLRHGFFYKYRTFQEDLHFTSPSSSI